jgi:hypothetical protein
MHYHFKLFVLTLVSNLFVHYTFSQEAEWAKNFPGAGLNEGYAIAADNNGNVYTSGKFSGTIDFNPGASSNTLTAGTAGSAFVSKLDALGNYVWAVQFEGIDGSFIKDIAVDLNGDLIVTGYFSGTIDIDLGMGTNNVTATGSRDLFVAKLSSAGSVLWFKQIGGTTIANIVEPYRIALDATGNIHVAGAFEGNNVNFNPNGTLNLSSTGSQDIFVLKLTNAGVFTWTKKMGGTLSDIGIGIAVDNNSNVLVTGYFTGTANFNPSGTNNLTAINQEDAYLLKLDANGDFQWVKQFGGIDLVSGNAIVCDNNNNAYLLGVFFGTVNLNPDGVQNATSAGFQDGFVVKLQPNGTFVWANVLSSANNISSNGIAIDENNNFYITGNFNGSTDFDPSGNTNIVNTLGGNDVYLAKYNQNGLFQWVYRAGSTNIERAWDVFYKSGALHITGYISGTANFNVGGTGLFLTATGSRDIFVAKIRECFPTTGTDTKSACESFTWINGNTYTANNNTATFTLTNAAGCDSVVTLNLTIKNATTGTDTKSACERFTWIDGNTYTANNNTATFTLTNAAGCDSVVTLNLTIKNATTGTDTKSACESFTWINGNTYTANNNTATFTLTNAAGCDSVVTLNLTIKNATTGTDTKSACESFTWIDGNTYTANNNTATFTLTNAAGCDSVVTLNLTIKNATTGTDTKSACESFTWIDGNTYTANNNTSTFTLTNAAGCDSVVTLNLTIKNATTGTDTKSACESFTWIDGNTYTANNNTATFTLTNAAGCDSVVTLNLTINPIYALTIDTAINSGQSIEIGGTLYTIDSTYTITLTTIAGCDSTITLNLSTITGFSNNTLPVVEAYPNPFKNMLYLNAAFYEAVLLDINGKPIAQFKNNETILNIPDIAAGMYFLSVTSANGKIIKKLIKE